MITAYIESPIPNQMKKLLRILGVVAGIATLLIGLAVIYLKTALPNIGPAEDLKIEYTTERIERGKYLANNVMVCIDCHSQRDFTKFAGPLKPGTVGAGGDLFGKEFGLPGNFYAPNLTPHHLADWSDGEIFRAITTGVSKDGRALFPIMPYPNFAKLDREDLYSVIAYIRTLDAVEYDVPASEAAFPMNFIINTMPQPASFTTKPDQNDLIAYGKYLMTSASCGDCHTPLSNGAPIEGMYLAGGQEFSFPDQTLVRSANITSDAETGIGSWSEEQFLQRFQTYRDSTFVPREVKDGDFKTVMPWLFYSRMEDEDLRAIYAYLKTVPPVKHQIEKFEIRGSAE